MTQLTFKSKIDDSQLSILLHLLESWNVDAEVIQEQIVEPKKSQHRPFSKTFGMWADRDIDGKQLRRDAWGLDKY
jgi:hypothetical protein